MGPQIGVEILRSLCPDSARGELRDFLQRYREYYVKKNPVIQESPDCVWVLQGLYDRWGAPLVVKIDGGREFHAEDFLALRRHWGVKLLVSPPYYPPYNGWVESCIWWMKLRTNHEACLRGSPGQWSVADMEKAADRQRFFQQSREPYALASAYQETCYKPEREYSTYNS